MDVFDRATEVEEVMREKAIEAKRVDAKREPQYKPCGACYNCGEGIPQGLVYCDGDCKSDHQHRIGRGGE